jgi:DNA-3-methyladenine glycosylase
VKGVVRDRESCALAASPVTPNGWESPSLRFFARDALTLARQLLGTLLVHESDEGPTWGRIVEVEAYRGPEDRAAHSYGGRRTARNEVMYGPAGHAYVYFVYGMHHCFNVVAAGIDQPEAVLVRALEPIVGIELMRRRRGDHNHLPVVSLARGPGNVCRAMGIDRSLNGADLLDGPLTIRRPRSRPLARIGSAPRVGVDYAGAHARRHWRLYDPRSAAVSARPRVGRPASD